MFDLTSPPDATDLEQLLTEANLLQAAGAVALELAVPAAVETWERRSGYKPFQAGADATVRKYNAPGGRMPRHRTYFALLSNLSGAGSPLGPTGGGERLKLETGMVAAPESVTIDDEDQLLGADYWCEPTNALADGGPYTAIRFRGPMWCQPEGIVVTARWGYCDSAWPADAYQAVLFSAGAVALTGVPDNLVESSITEDGFAQEFMAASAIVPAARLAIWNDHYGRALRRYTLMS